MCTKRLEVVVLKGEKKRNQTKTCVLGKDLGAKFSWDYRKDPGVGLWGLGGDAGDG